MIGTIIEPKGVDVNWLRDSPESWKVRRIKDIVLKISSGVTPKGGSETYIDNGIPLIRSQNVYNDGLRLQNVSFISNEVHSKMSNSKVKPFDVLINITGASIGRTCVVPDYIQEANINQHIICLRTKSENVEYLAYYLQSNSVQEYIMSIQAGSSKEALNMVQTLNIPLPQPNIPVQRGITSFLDAKTEVIDKKIKLLQEKIAIYKEYRYSLINETVTKGLNKKVSLKDSRIEWVGEIPEHWEIKRFKYFAKTIKGKSLITSEKHFDKSLPLITLEYLRNESVQHPTFAYSTDSSLQTTAEDFIIVWDGAAVGEILKAKEGYLSSTIAKIKINKKLYDPKYFYHLRDFIDYTLKQIPTGMGIPHLNPNLLKNFKCPYPPLEEQSEIAEFLDSKTETIDKIVGNIKKQIKTLKELRKTLINDVVMGKIKVTG